MFGFEIRAVIFVFLKPVSEAWNKKHVKFVSMCESDAIQERASYACVGNRVVVSVFLEPGSEVRNQKRVKIVLMCEPDATRERLLCLGLQFKS